MNPIVEVGEPALGLGAQYLLQFRKKRLAAGQFEEGFLFFDHGVVFVGDPFERVEIAGGDHFAEDAGIQEAGLVDHIDLGRQAAHQAQQLFQRPFGEHIVDVQDIEGEPRRSIRPARCTMRVGFQCRS